MEGFLGFLLVALPLYGIYWLFFKDKKSVKTQYEQAEDGPMQVNIIVEPIADAAAARFLRGRGLTHSLTVDVKLSKKDWAAVKSAGLYDAVLFQYPDVTSTYSDEMQDYRVNRLAFKGAVSFYNINQCEEAKQTLIQNLHNLKASMESGGRQEVSFEL